MESCRSNCARCTRASRAAEPERSATQKVALVGLPNSGKSQIFNRLTGQYTLVANYPLTTLVAARKKVCFGERCYELIDTPGMHSLYIHSEEELAVREMLFAERPDIILQCVDANRLQSSLKLTADLLELEVPMVVAVNAVDETARRGIWIDSARLSERLGVPVVETVAEKGLGIDELAHALSVAETGAHGHRYGEGIEQGIDEIAALVPDEIPFPRKTALLFLGADAHLASQLTRTYPEADVPALEAAAQGARQRFRASVATTTARVRNRWVDDIVAAVLQTQRAASGQVGRALGHMSRHPIWGLPILGTLLALFFLLVVNVANHVADWMTSYLWEPVQTVLVSIIPPGFWFDFLIGEYGVISFGLANALLTVLPILSVFFLAFNIVEDSGYIPNMSVMTRRLLQRLGLSGAAIMPLVLGFGCKTMATMATKPLQSKKEKYIAVVLIASSIPCAAQLGLNLSILGRLGINAFLIVFGLMGVLFVAAGLLLNVAIRDRTSTDYVQALPPMRMPSPRAILVKTYYRLYWFLEEALPVFVIAAAALFAVDRLGILDALKVGLAPVIQGFLGLPLDMVDALILCIARQEAAAALIINLIERGQLNYIQCIVAVVITMRFVPCFNTIVAMIKEIGWIRALPTIVAINTVAFGVAGGLNWALVWAFGG